jgi:hypothetical protein
MNFGQIKAEVQKNLVRQQQEIIDLIPIWINRTMQDVCRLHNFSFLKVQETITFYENMNTYDLPATYKDELRIWLQLTNDYKQLQPITLQEALELFPPATTNAEPMYYRLIDSQYIIYPTPDKNYTGILEYYQYLPELVNDEDTNYITNNYPDVLVNGATWRGMVWLQEGDATLYRALYDEAVQRMISQDQARRIPPRIFMKYSLGARKSPLRWKG